MKFNFFQFLKSFAFFSGILKALAVLSCLAIGWLFNQPLAGLNSGLTIVMISNADIPGNRKHHLLGIAIATLFVALSLLAINLTVKNIYLLLPTMAILAFFYAYVCLYGARASMVSLAGIFSISLTFGNPPAQDQIFLYAFYCILAGAWYIFLVQVYMWIKPRQYSEKILGKCMSITADFFDTRADLITDPDNIEYRKKLVSLQTSLSEEFEKLRELLFNKQSKSGKTGYLQRQFLIFIELVDVFEVAMSNPIPYNGLKNYFEKDSIFISDYSDLIREFADNLRDMSQYIGSRKSFKTKKSLKKSLRNFSNAVKLLSQEEGVSEKKIQLLTSLYQYLKNQSEKVEVMQVIFSNYYDNQQGGGDRDVKTWQKFVSSRSYSPKRLLDHLSIHSTFFRHAIRMSVVTVVGYLIGYYFQLLNGYWILFTAYVIMRPGYAVTKNRSKERIIGTIIGILVVTLIVVLTQFVFHLENYKVVYGVIAIMCMPFAYGMLQDNFSLCVVFITTYILLIFAMFVHNIQDVIVYRVIDTFIGVLLSVIANSVIFPSWEKKSFLTLFDNCIDKISGYIDAVVKRSETFSGPTTEYKVARKKAFLSLASLNSGFQRLIQEPKRDKNENNKLAEIIVLLQDFLSCTAAIALQLPSQKENELFPQDTIKEFLLGVKQKILNKDFNDENLLSSLDLIKQKSEENNTYLLYYEQFTYLYQLSKKINSISIK